MISDSQTSGTGVVQMQNGSSIAVLSLVVNSLFAPGIPEHAAATWGQGH
jgi:hypothetical protein